MPAVRQVLGVRQDNPREQGTAVTKKYQNNEFDTSALACPSRAPWR
jgi:hypothetical protein